MMILWRGVVTASRSTAAAFLYGHHHWKNASRPNLMLFSSKQQQKEPPSTKKKRDVVVQPSSNAVPPTATRMADEHNADSTATAVLTFFRAVYVHPISKMVLKRIQDKHLLADDSMNHSLSIVPPNGTFCLTFQDHIMIQRVSTIFDASKQAHYLQVDFKNQKKSKRVLLLSQGNSSSKTKHETLQEQIHAIVDESLGTTTTMNP